LKINEVFEKLIENPKDVYQCFLNNRYELSVSDMGFFHLKVFDGNRELDPHSRAGGFGGILRLIPIGKRCMNQWILSQP